MSQDAWVLQEADAKTELDGTIELLEEMPLRENGGADGEADGGAITGRGRAVP